MPESTVRLAVTLGSSFLGCPTHHGFLRELIRSDWTPSVISGCSTGAIVAGLYAAGVTIEAMEELFTRRNLNSCFYEWQTPFRALGTLLGVPGCPCIFHGKKLGSLLAELVGDKRIEDCATARLHIAVTNLRTSSVEIRDHGPLVETILASCAMPGVITPRKIGGELLWDGALGSSVPVEPFLENETITHLAAHSIIFEKQIRVRERSHRYSFVGAMLAGNQLAADELLYWKLELARRAGKTVVSAETITPRPRLGPPLTLPPPKPWPEYARDFMRLGAASARHVITGFTTAAETPAANC
jgi:NTE family protein